MCAWYWSQSGGIPAETAAAEGGGGSSGLAASEAFAQAGAAGQLNEKENAKEVPSKLSQKDGGSANKAGKATADAAANGKQAAAAAAAAAQQRGTEAVHQHKQQKQHAGGPQHKGAQQEAQHVAHPGMLDEPKWFAKLSSKGCRNAEELRVCSHRARLAVEGVPPGSLTAYTTLVTAGVSCFDIDFVLTSDGALLATHPEDLQAAVDRAGGGAGNGAGSSKMASLAGHLQDFSLADLRAAGADEERFPTADTLIKVFAGAIDAAGLLWRPAKGADEPNYDKLPVLLMDLKGPAYSLEVIDGIAAAAQAAEVTAHIALFVASDGQLQLVQRTQWKGPLIRAYMDREDPSPKLSAEALAPFTLLGPSIKMSDAFFSAATQLGKPILAWTADTPADLHRAAEANLNAVVSNRPIALRAVLMDWRDRCSERQRRQRQQRRSLVEAGGGERLADEGDHSSVTTA